MQSFKFWDSALTQAITLLPFLTIITHYHQPFNDTQPVHSIT